MSKNKKNVVVNKGKKSDVEFSNEFNIGLDYNTNLQESAKEEINKVKEFFEGIF